MKQPGTVCYREALSARIRYKYFGYKHDSYKNVYHEKIYLTKCLFQHILSVTGMRTLVLLMN